MNFKVKQSFFFALYSIRREDETLLNQGTMGRNLIVLLKNGKKGFSICVLTATLWFWTRGCNVYISNNVDSLSFDYLDVTTVINQMLMKANTKIT